MDVAASLLTLIGAAVTIADKLHQTTSRLRHAPDEIVALLNEGQLIRILLYDVQERGLTSNQWLDLSALGAVVRRAQKQLHGIHGLVGNFVTQNAREELKFNRVTWYLKKDEVDRQLLELRSIRDNLVGVMSCATLSANLQISLSVRSIAHALQENSLAEHNVLAGLAHFQAQTAASLQAIEQRFAQPALMQPISKSNSTSGLLEGSEALTQRENPAARIQTWEAIRPVTAGDARVSYPSLLNCSLSCTCMCHKRYVSRSPASTDQLFGRILVCYRGPQPFSTGCSSAKCVAHRGLMLTIQYTFPRWLLGRMLHVVGSTIGDPKVVFSVPKIISQDAPVFEMARLGDILGMQMEFSERGISPLVVTEHGETLIQETIHNGFPKAARFLIQAGANPTVENDVSVTPGQEAWDYILRRVFDEATLQEYRVIFADSGNLDERGFTVIHEYVLGLRQATSFNAAIEESIHEIDTIDTLGRTAAHWAVLRGDLDKLRSLLLFGANPDIKDYTWGNTPLDYAVRCTTADCTHVLIEHGANVNTRTTCMWTPLYGCGAYRKSKVAESHVESARLLLSNGADINARDEDGVDALMKATRQEIPLLVKFLLEEGCADVNTFDRDHVSALAYAIRRQSHESLAVLLDHGADYLTTDSWGNTILHAAAAQADSVTLQVLQTYGLEGLDPDVKRGDGLTPREIAIQRNDKPKGFLSAFLAFVLRLKAKTKNPQAKVKVEPTASAVEAPSVNPEVSGSLVAGAKEECSSDEDVFEDAQS